MRFALSEETQALRDAAAGLLASEVPPALVRAGDRGQVAGAWRKLAGTGATGAIVAEEHGGAGLDENSLVPLLEEIGYSALPAPAAETIAVAAPLLSGGSHADLLAGLLDGDTLVSVVSWDGHLVPFHDTATLIVARDGARLHGYRAGELDLEPEPTVDGARPVARLRRTLSGGVLITGDPVITEAAWLRGMLGTSALLTGLARRMLDMTVGYVTQREQFGVPVGSFQAIKHALADALVAVEFARPLVLAAAWALASGAPDAPRQVSAGKVRAARAARLVARIAIQCHGAIGYTTEYDLHLFAKRAWALALSWGSQEWHLARIAESLGVADGR